MTGSLELDATAWAALRRLLDDALALPRTQRAAWLAGLPDEHAALKPHLARLLAHADDDGGLARFDALPALHDTAANDATPPPEAGPYRCIRLIAEGGMS